MARFSLKNKNKFVKRNNTNKYVRLARSSLKLTKVQNVIANINEPIFEMDVDKSQDFYSTDPIDNFNIKSSFPESSTHLNNENSHSKMLFEKSFYSIEEAALLIVSFALRFSLSNIACKSLVQLIKELLPIKNLLPKSFNKLLKKVLPKKSKIEVKLFCSTCSYELNSQKHCQNEECECFSLLQNNTGVFHYVDIKNQIEEILSSYWNYIETYRVSDKKVLDFINSNFYKEIPNTINLYLCTDGIPVFKNPARSAYPVYLNIVELPPFLRESKRTKIIAGVWFGTGQPTSNILFSELISNVNSLEIQIVHNGNPVNLKARLHVVQGDLPGKAKILDMKSHKGFFCCPYCFIRGIKFDLKNFF